MDIKIKYKISLDIIIQSLLYSGLILPMAHTLLIRVNRKHVQSHHKQGSFQFEAVKQSIYHLWQ